MKSKLLIPALLFSLGLHAQDSSQYKHITLEETKVESSRKQKSLTFSTFESKMHISLDGMHDKFGIKTNAKKLEVGAINAAIFNNESKGNLNLVQIDGKIKPFDSTAVRIYVAIIQNDKVLKTVELRPGNISKNQFSLKLKDVAVETGEFLITYFMKFEKPYEVWQLVNHKKEGRIILVKQQNDSFLIKSTSSNLGSMPCPQFKVTALKDDIYE